MTRCAAHARRPLLQTSPQPSEKLLTLVGESYWPLFVLRVIARGSLRASRCYVVTHHTCEWAPRSGSLAKERSTPLVLTRRDAISGRHFCNSVSQVYWLQMLS